MKDDEAHHWRRPTLLAAAALLLASLVPAQVNSMSDQALASGKVDIRFVDVKGYDTPEARIEAVIDAPPEKVWRVIGDCASYDETMPRIADAKLIKKRSLGGAKSEHICKIIVDMPMPFSNLSAVTRAIHVEGPTEWSRHWKLVRGDYTINNGSWVLTKFDEAGTRTRVKYRLHAEPTTPIPDWIRTRAQESSFPDLIDRLREEVRELD